MQAAKWYHIAHYAQGPGEKAMRVELKTIKGNHKTHDPSCTDGHASCGDWAATGECKTNAAFMVGDKRRPGVCILSCDRCDLAQFKVALGRS
jgi:prolyl 4-hydroxylase